jgi:hypothetical protein
MNDENANVPKVPIPRTSQLRVLNLDGRYQVAVCGRRFGKTVAAGIAAVQLCEIPGRERKRVWWISPIQSQSDRVEREIAYWLSEKFPKRGRAKPAEGAVDQSAPPEWEHRKSEHALIHINSKSRIEFHSAHAPDSLRGAGLDLAIIDEAADVSEYTWKNVIKPMLLESKGRAMIVGTPRGTNHWLHRIFLLGQNPQDERKLYASIRLPTTANEELPADEIDAYRLEMSEDEFRQEFEAEFIDGAGCVFKDLKNAIDAEHLQRGRPGAQYITGIDLGDKQDFTVLCSIAIATHRLEGFARFNNIGWHEQTVRIHEHLGRFPGPCVIDATGPGDPVFESIQRARRGVVIGLKFNASNKEESVKGLEMGISSGNLKLAPIPQLINELQAYQRLDDGPRATGHHRRYGAPPGLFDDCVMSLTLAWYGLNKLGLWGIRTENPIRDGLFG